VAAFALVQPATPDEAGYKAAWDKAFETAKSYWVPGDEIGAAEILVAGPIELSLPHLQLIPFLRKLGLVE